MCKVSLNAVKYLRGQVWYVREDESVTKALRDAGSRVINGSRPYLIVNVVNNNLVTVCPLTTNLNEQFADGNDIVFDHIADVTGGGYSSSRIIISQIQTKNSHELERYLYSFDQTSIDIIMQHVYNQLGFEQHAKDDDRNEPKEDDPDIEIEEPVKQVVPKPVTCIKKVLPTETLAKLEIRLKGKLKRSDALFRTKEEALCYLAECGDKPAKEVANHFSITPSQAYNWKHTAKNKASEA